MRLIDADALFMENMRTILEPLGNGQYEEVEIVYFRDIENAPTIDAVQVVRCKECVYRPCKQMPYSYDHDYCSYGERKEKMRLIDADKLLDAISVHLERIEQEFDDAPTITNIKYTPYTIETTGESKTETINPVKHGRWVIDEKTDSEKCSECGADALIDKVGVGYVIQLCSNYCPNCGARMDGDEE